MPQTKENEGLQRWTSRTRLALTLSMNPKSLMYDMDQFCFLSPLDTLSYLQKNEVGLVRFGDGEISYLYGYGRSFESHKKNLEHRLKEILMNYSKNRNYLIAFCFDKVFGKPMGDSSYYGVAKYGLRPYLKPKCIYGHHHVFRPALSCFRDEDPTKYESELSGVFNGYDTVYVSDKLRGKNRVDIKKFIQIPPENSFKKYKKIKDEIINASKQYSNPLILLRAGPTASVMSAELNRKGILTYDVGKLFTSWNQFESNINKC